MLKRTPLFEEHLVLKARMVAFGGWEMPVQYEGILAEYAATRKAATLFDTSHMGEFIVEGDCRKTGLDRLITMPIADMPCRTSRYGLLLNENGGVIDDLIVFRVSEEKWFCVVNGATTDKDAKHIQENLTDGAVFWDISSEWGKIDLQGPKSREILNKFVPDIGKLNYFAFDYFDLLGENVLISRTGYTGELGYEIFFPWSKTADLWRRLLGQDGVSPAGLGARDLLRLEMGYSLYGHELNDEISPLEAGLSRFIDFEKEFIGKESLLRIKEQGLSRKIIGLIGSTRRPLRADQKIYSESGKEIGIITSGTFSPFVGKGIGLGLVAAQHAVKGNTVFFGDEKIKNQATISERIFFRQGSLKA